jgi:hypothetical protein
MGVAMSQRLGGLTPCEMNERFIDAFSTSLAFAGCVDGTHRGRQPAVMLLYKGMIFSCNSWFILILLLQYLLSNAICFSTISELMKRRTSSASYTTSKWS